MNRHPTSKELLEMFMKSYHDTITELAEELKFRKKSKQNTEVAKLHYTVRIIQKYFNFRGGLPI